MDYAYFAVRLGWSVEQYESMTPLQRLFIRKEIETYTVEQTRYIEWAVRTAIHNAHSKKIVPLWQKAIERDESITDEEIAKVQAVYMDNAPWVPWGK